MKFRMKMASSVIAGLLVVTALAMAGQDMAAQIAAAKTAADHEAIAAEYTKDAAALRADADRHDKMAKQYTGSFKDKLHLDVHCEAVAANDRSSAKELDELAAAHRAAAKEAGK